MPFFLIQSPAECGDLNANLWKGAEMISATYYTGNVFTLVRADRIDEADWAVETHDARIRKLDGSLTCSHHPVLEHLIEQGRDKIAKLACSESPLCFESHTMRSSSELPEPISPSVPEGLGGVFDSLRPTPLPDPVLAKLKRLVKTCQHRNARIVIHWRKTRTGWHVEGHVDADPRPFLQ
jgi:hypothetical protein